MYLGETSNSVGPKQGGLAGSPSTFERQGENFEDSEDLILTRGLTKE